MQLLRGNQSPRGDSMRVFFLNKISVHAINTISVIASWRVYYFSFYRRQVFHVRKTLLNTFPWILWKIVFNKIIFQTRCFR
jgi:hypothetical protein